MKKISQKRVDIILEMKKRLVLERASLSEVRDSGRRLLEFGNEILTGRYRSEIVNLEEIAISFNRVLKYLTEYLGLPLPGFAQKPGLNVVLSRTRRWCYFAISTCCLNHGHDEIKVRLVLLVNCTACS